MTLRAAALGALFVLLFLLPVGAFASEDPIPESLEEWIPWALRGHETAKCALIDATPLCVWPGRLILDLDDRGGRFSIDAVFDAPSMLALPGDTTRWPQNLRTAAGSAVLTSTAAPGVYLPEGTHRVSGTFEWARLPQSLSVPPSIALVELTVRGQRVQAPRRDVDGLLWLQSGASEEAEEDRLAIEVNRRIDDGVPVEILTKLRLRVSGRSREVSLGTPTLEGTTPTALTSSLPARLDGDGALQVQLRPGEWEITIAARSDGPVPSLTAPASSEPWPAEEVWVFQAAPTVRSVRVDGAPGVDPSRTALPDAWRSLPAWRVAGGESLQFVELRRGEADPPPGRLEVNRQMWLSLDGTEFAIQDRLTGRISQGGRLELQAPGDLGRARVGSQDQLVTQGDGGRGGVEVRDGELYLEGTSVWDRSASMPAVGWNRDAKALRAQLHLPPGWRLLAATGVDDANGSWIERWTLMDLFLVLLIALAVGRLTSRGWAGITLVVLALSWQEADAPTEGWILLLAVLGILRVLPAGGFKKLVNWLRWAVVVGMAVHVVVFSWNASRQAFFPQLDRDGSDALGNANLYDAGVMFGDQPVAESAGFPNAPQQEMQQADQTMEKEISARPKRGLSQTKKKSSYGGPGTSGGWVKRAARLDPQAVVQTGPGLPRWSWKSHNLVWNGPVSTDHEIKLHLAGPVTNTILGLAHVGGAILLLLLLGDPRRTGTSPVREPEEADAPTPAPSPSPTPVIATLLALGFLCLAGLPATALGDIPSPELLTELRTELTTRPDCEPNCAQVATLDLRADARRITITAEVHAAALAPWRLPGPDSSWAPTRVRLDGLDVVALHRDAKGFLVLRIPEGVHTVVLEGPARDEIALQFPDTPRVLTWSGDGWTLAGHRADAPPPSAVQLSRSRPLDGAAGGASAEENAELPPWLQIQRELDLGVPWLVHNVAVRLGGGNRAVLLRVPLLPGESVTTPGVLQEGDVAVVTLEPGERVRAWDSTLAETGTLTLTSPTDQPWTEVWSLDCSPIWSCATDGLAPTRHLHEGRWLPEWQPWPGESLKLTLARPAPAEGTTTTVDSVSMELTSGRRLMEANLRVGLRSSQGGEQSITLPPGAALRTFRLNGKDHPAQADGDRLVFAIEPGATDVYAEWGLPAADGLLQTAPPVDIGQDAANVQVQWTLPDHRWVLWTWGPAWGPVVTVWQYILLLLLVAFLLARFAPTPLTGPDWFLLGLGLTQIPVPLSAVLVLWLIALALRGRGRPKKWFIHDFIQLVLIGLTFAALAVLYGAIYQGLVLRPDLGVSGGGSYGNTLLWFTDRSTGALPEPGVLWLPTWVWRVAMLLWSLWLASRLLKWLRWGWEQLRVGGLWSWPPRTSTPAPLPSIDADATGD